jgi:hypothetical protein
LKIPNIFSKVKSYPITALDRSLGLQEGEAFRTYTKSAQESGKVVSPTVCLITKSKYIVVTEFENLLHCYVLADIYCILTSRDRKPP